MKITCGENEVDFKENVKYLEHTLRGKYRAKSILKREITDSNFYGERQIIEQKL